MAELTQELVEHEARTLRQQAEQSVAFMQQMYGSIQELRAHKERLERELEEEQQKLRKETAIREEAEERITELEKQIEDLKTETSKKIQQLQQENEELSVVIAQLKQTIVEKDAFLEKTIQEKDELLRKTVEEKDAYLEMTVTEKEAFLKKTVAEKDQIIDKLHHEISTQEGLMKGLKFMRMNVDSFRCGDAILSEPCGACMLPNNFVLVADTLEGLLLFSAHTELIKKVTSDVWKWPQGLIYDVAKGHILVSMVKKFGEGAEGWRRVITYFSLDLEELETIDGPDNSVISDTIAKERLAMGPHGELYMTLADNIGSALYAYIDKQWFLLTKRQGATFTDCQVLATVPPITEILVVESRMGYLHKFSVRGMDICDRKSIAAVEKPGAICVDDKGQLFVHDVASGKVRQVHNITFDAMRDVCIIDDTVFSITASHGYLGVAVRAHRLVKIFRYQ